MCFLSVQCACKHNIAIPHPNKICIRPRHPRGCWLIRRGEPVANRCPACEEYFNPQTEQLLWSEVMNYHVDPGIDWSETTHGNVIAADKARHKCCENERLDFMRRLRWKAMIKKGMLEGWKLTERGAMVQDLDEDDPIDEDEVMEAVDKHELQKLVWDEKEVEGAGIEEEPIGYELRRIDGGLLRTIPEERLDDDTEDEGEDDGSFRLVSSTDTSTSEASSEPINEDASVGQVTIAYIPEEEDDVLLSPEYFSEDEEEEAHTKKKSRPSERMDGASSSCSLGWMLCGSLVEVPVGPRSLDGHISIGFSEAPSISKSEASGSTTEKGLHRADGATTEPSLLVGEREREKVRTRSLLGSPSQTGLDITRPNILLHPTQEIPDAQTADAPQEKNLWKDC
ncbi:hypothetical protein ABW20_dc0105019 [Dactylellina cionopaga]|nr:hypothetical protein ABW20_dc0105019 [Dactylellina cionopaga]